MRQGKGRTVGSRQGAWRGELSHLNYFETPFRINAQESSGQVLLAEWLRDIQPSFLVEAALSDAAASPLSCNLCCQFLDAGGEAQIKIGCHKVLRVQAHSDIHRL